MFARRMFWQRRKMNDFAKEICSDPELESAELETEGKIKEQAKRIARIRLGNVAAVALMAASTMVLGEQKMISVGDRRISIYCDGKAGTLPTVILVPAGGRTAKDWSKVQPAVASFTRVCSYDHANFGASDKAPVPLQSVEDVVDDLHAWLQASGEQGPFVLVSHSNSGIYVRRFETRYRQDVAGLVFLDSAHEEQALRLHELDPLDPSQMNLWPESDGT
ncbi:alpha/beta fold hydrolase [Terriglobus albidus]|uniref:alpha/beta fold hydrolase n=1 Tax=Terriglobus albidus TaxID=1592106 RepID=UPI0021E0A610|nr:alpha/beta hydrolase [Terriglobus albidus]